MLFFKKNKIKMSIIEDYIKLLAFENFFKNDFSIIDSNILNVDLLATTNQKFVVVFDNYNHTLKRLKMNDLSLLILKKELKDCNFLFLKQQETNFKNINSTIHNIDIQLELLNFNLNKKQKELNIVPFENVV